jgi:hypothetical protein
MSQRTPYKSACVALKEGKGVGDDVVHGMRGPQCHHQADATGY